MEIPSKGPLLFMPARNRPSETLAPPSFQAVGEQRKHIEKDIVSLTDKGRRFEAAVQHMRSLPDIREDRIMQLKRQIEEGTYRVKGDRIASNMIDETLENNIVLKQIDTTHDNNPKDTP